MASLVGLVLTSSTVIILIFYIVGNRSIDTLANDLINSVTEIVTKNTISYLQPAAKSSITGRELRTSNLVTEIRGFQRSKGNPEYKTILKGVEKILSHYTDEKLKKFKISRKELKNFLLSKNPRFTAYIRLFKSLLATYEQINLFNYGNYAKDKVLVKEMPDGSISIKYVYHYLAKGVAFTAWDHSNIKYYSFNKENSKLDFANNIEPIKGSYDPATKKLSKGAYDPTKRKWFKGAKESYLLAKRENRKPKVFWTQAYVWTSDRKPGISCSIAVENKKGEMEGVIAVGLEIYELSAKHLANLKVGKNGKVFIFNDKGEMIAYDPGYKEIKNPKERELKIRKELKDFVKPVRKVDSKGRVKYKYKLTPIEEFKNPLYKATFINGRKKPYQPDKLKRFNFTHNDIPYIGVLAPFPKDSSIHWFVGMAIPEDDFLGEVKENTLYVIILSMLIVLLSFGVGLLIASRISRPLKLLEQETSRIQRFELDNPVQFKTSLTEISEMRHAFHNMIAGLRSFKKFVPSDLVQYLIQSGQEATLGGENKILSVYFSDIVGFTSISERLNPEDLVRALGEYLEEMSSIINDNEGTVDKYIGDAVMAFWGAPKDCADHAYLSCKSAIENQKRLAMLRYTRWKGEGKPLFEARIGINAGELIVGNMGSHSRMNYTVIGDTVNLASRLEGINKFYGTTIACSESTYALVKDRIATRKLDLVAVKGKTEAVAIYEVLGFKNETTPRVELFVRKYEEALELYLAHHFQDALKLFTESMRIKADTSAKIFIDRCEGYLLKPPASDWNGVSVFTSK